MFEALSEANLSMSLDFKDPIAFMPENGIRNRRNVAKIPDCSKCLLQNPGRSKRQGNYCGFGDLCPKIWGFQNAGVLRVPLSVFLQP